MKKESLVKRLGVSLSYVAIALVLLVFFWAASLTGQSGLEGIFNAYQLIFPLIVAIAFAVGIGFDHSGAAALAGAVGYLVFGASFSILIDAKVAFMVTEPIAVFGGIFGTQIFFIICGFVMGIASGLMYNKFYNIKMPEWLAFFGGRRFVPIITSVVALFIGSFIANIMLPHL
ncbi:PTS transporter subunit EIIC [Brochothrix campestris]|uniref:Phosphotransferase system (PTS) glucosamine-specific enzyme IICBA component n=1 Tax=Brochothrix campestris FSL F6-1037 TaxID=1265861 RepID=W7CE63_9LIST|nr:PTS transporter subunit EIIC [Brochothrix campestris]EUJ37619.1 phosphotransferase system (PTS) glucosamine-specific enzyme IICBA component [Brochothrix campestris FSL F6-1037]